jgi:hypothetical protein
MTSSKPLKVQKKDTIDTKSTPAMWLCYNSQHTTINVLQINDYKFHNSDTSHGPFLLSSHQIFLTASKTTSTRTNVIVLNQALHHENIQGTGGMPLRSLTLSTRCTRVVTSIHTSPLPSNKGNSAQ